MRSVPTADLRLESAHPLQLGAHEGGPYDQIVTNTATFRLTYVPITVTSPTISLGAGRLSRRYSGSRSEVGARGWKDTVYPRAARASCLPALGPAREVLTGLGQAKAGNARADHVPGSMA